LACACCFFSGLLGVFFNLIRPFAFLFPWALSLCFSIHDPPRLNASQNSRRVLRSQELRLPRIQLDDELFIHDRGNLFARRNTRHFALELIFVSD
jgi:hypothetical protein